MCPATSPRGARSGEGWQGHRGRHQPRPCSAHPRRPCPLQRSRHPCPFSPLPGVPPPACSCHWWGRLAKSARLDFNPCPISSSHPSSGCYANEYFTSMVHISYSPSCPHMSRSPLNLPRATPSPPKRAARGRCSSAPPARTWSSSWSGAPSAVPLSCGTSSPRTSRAGL